MLDRVNRYRTAGTRHRAGRRRAPKIVFWCVKPPLRPLASGPGFGRDRTAAGASWNALPGCAIRRMTLASRPESGYPHVAGQFVEPGILSDCWSDGSVPGAGVTGKAGRCPPSGWWAEGTIAVVRDGKWAVGGSMEQHPALSPDVSERVRERRAAVTEAGKPTSPRRPRGPLWRKERRRRTIRKSGVDPARCRPRCG